MHLLQSLSMFFQRLVSFDAPIATFSYSLVPIGAYFAFRQQRAREDLGVGFRAFMRFCFLRHDKTTPIFPSMRLDIGFVLVKSFVNGWLLVPLLLSSALAATFSYDILVRHLGARPQIAPSLAMAAAMIAVCVLVQDFVQFFVHYAHHKIKLLWAVHKVHHSSEFLLFSFSVKRTHILEEAINLTLTSAFLGVLIGLMSYAFSLAIWKSEIYGVDAWFLLQLFSFWHLRHSHISLSYGWFEKILQSPAQHQLHHSQEVEHWDKNFGLLFSIWDRMFGCFLYSTDPRSFRVGLPEADRRDYDTVAKLYFMPFRKMYEAAAQPVQRLQIASRPSSKAPRSMPRLDACTDQAAPVA